MLSFGFILLMALFNGAYNHFNLQQSFEVVAFMNKNSEPSLAAIRDLKMMVRDSKAYTTNWVYVRNNTVDKALLKELHNTNYPELKSQIQELAEGWISEEEKKSADTLLTEFDSLISVQQAIMNRLNSMDDYEDLLSILDSEDDIENLIIPRADTLDFHINQLLEARNNSAAMQKANLSESMTNMQWAIWTLTGLAAIFCLLVSIWLTRSLTSPIVRLKDAVDHLRVGEIPESVPVSNQDEIGQMAEAVNDMISGLNSYAQFAQNVGQGNLESEFDRLGDNDALGTSLIEMRNNLRDIASDDEKRNWAVEGFAKFSETLRSNTSDIKELCDAILMDLVKYTNSSQGAIFVADSEEEILKLNASYAWGRKKHQENIVRLGEGLVGQCMLEADTIFLTEVPANFVTIASGLGESNPRCIVLVPMKLNDQVYGVIELASFNTFQPFEVEFLEKLCESIASSISNVKVNEQTKKLLAESQILANESKAQEEELRQNQEEMAATQEEAERNLRMAQETISKLRSENEDFRQQLPLADSEEDS